eukprot:TRINITY_DN2653_c0_g1_i1.p1 TRINITY_DN2653_c0_g1~~TRINITY_DN2653_c0_g1_i1.p1  ORF type:complete len:474 (+),score=100.54 TRINITY_DN2653_c0_g1_i1:172-1593(+)
MSKDYLGHYYTNQRSYKPYPTDGNFRPPQYQFYPFSHDANFNQQRFNQIPHNQVARPHMAPMMTPMQYAMNRKPKNFQYQYPRRPRPGTPAGIMRHQYVPPPQMPMRRKNNLTITSGYQPESQRDNEARKQRQITDIDTKIQQINDRLISLEEEKTNMDMTEKLLSTGVVLTKKIDEPTKVIFTKPTYDGYVISQCNRTNANISHYEVFKNVSKNSLVQDKWKYSENIRPEEYLIKDRPNCTQYQISVIDKNKQRRLKQDLLVEKCVYQVFENHLKFSDDFNNIISNYSKIKKEHDENIISMYLKRRKIYLMEKLKLHGTLLIEAAVEAKKKKQRTRRAAAAIELAIEPDEDAERKEPSFIVIDKNNYFSKMAPTPQMKRYPEIEPAFKTYNFLNLNNRINNPKLELWWNRRRFSYWTNSQVEKYIIAKEEDTVKYEAKNNFFRMAKNVPGKTRADLVDFFYLNDENIHSYEY